MNALVLFYSMYGHTYRLAEGVAEGLREIDGARVTLRRVPETISERVLEETGAREAQKAFAQIETATIDELRRYDAILVGTPTRFGNMCGQMRTFWDQTGPLWADNALVGKVGSAFTGSATQHGGGETTILSIHLTLLHQGMVVVGLPYSFEGQSRMDEISGGSPYGIATISGPSGERMPSDNELEGARFQGRHVGEIAARLHDR